MIYMITAERDLSAHYSSWIIKAAICQKGLLRNLGELSCIILLNLFAEDWNTEKCCKVQLREFRRQEQNLKISISVLEVILSFIQLKDWISQKQSRNTTITFHHQIWIWFCSFDFVMERVFRCRGEIWPGLDLCVRFIQRDSCRSRWPGGGPDPWETVTPFVKRQGGI